MVGEGRVGAGVGVGMWGWVWIDRMRRWVSRCGCLCSRGWDVEGYDRDCNFLDPMPR